MNEGNQVIVCNKDDILLTKKKGTNCFSLQFNVKNPNIVLKNLIKPSIYDLIYELNKDVVERIERSDMVMDSNCFDVLFVFKRFGSELGIAQKYMFLTTTRETDENQIRLLSKSVPYSNQVPNCETAICEYANLIVNIVSDNEVNINYEFHMKLEYELPKYMENIAGLLMKKIFNRLKIFIENIS